VSIGSAPLAPATLKKLQDRMPQASVINSYGLTEAGPAFITMPKDEAPKRIGSVGKPMPPMEVKVVDPDTDELREPNAVGELLVRLPGKRREYYKDDGASASTWTDDGWLRTGDLAYLDADGFVYISGRIKDMIIRGGNNIYATDVEAVILEHPDVQEAAVIGVPHQVLGEDVGAFVVRKPGVALDEAGLTAFCEERLADYKRPRRLWFVEELPRNATGKVMKHKLREEVAQK
jgi:acyl-CoA synthetase (AMP-forming)/AMP-acid ligase II